MLIQNTQYTVYSLCLSVLPSLKLTQSMNHVYCMSQRKKIFKIERKKKLCIKEL